MKEKIKEILTDCSTPEKTKRRQTLLLSATAISFVALISGVYFTAAEPVQQEMPFSIDDAKGRINIGDLTGGAKAEDRWIELAETKLQDVAVLKEEMQRLKQDNQKLEEKLQKVETQKSELVDHQAIVDTYFNEMEGLKQQIAKIRDTKTNKKPIRNVRTTGEKTNVVLPNARNDVPFGRDNNAISSIPKAGILDVDFDLVGSKGSFEHFNTREYMPAGSYVSAVVISGVDASVGLSSQADPRPILFRINSGAKSALHDGKELQVDIDGCLVTGAASGDLSSEKVFVRLLKMTCANGEETVIESDVKGYASAVGKAGVRGPVTSREGDLVVKSFFAGLAGGIGSGVAQSMTTPATIIGGVATEDVSVSDIVGQGVGTGISTSADRVADYLIERAEQYQPVITIAAGINVELVFHEGVYLDGRKKTKKKKG